MNTSRKATLLRRMWLLVAVLFTGLLWGLAPALSKIAMDTGAHPLGLTLWLLGGSGVLLLLPSLARRRRIPCDRAHLSLYIIAGAAGSIPGIVVFIATQHITVGVIAILTAGVPLMTYLAALALHIERLSPWRFTGIAMGLVAVLLLAWPGAEVGIGQGIGPDISPGIANSPGTDFDMSRATSTLWVLIALLIPLGYTVENLYIALRRPPHTDTLSLACGLMMMSAVLLAPLVYLADAFVPLSLPFGRVEYTLLGLVLITSLCYVVFLEVVREAGPVFAALIGYTIMLFGVCWGIWLFDEKHTAWVWTAVVLMLAGMVLVRERALPGAPEIGSNV